MKKMRYRVSALLIALSTFFLLMGLFYKLEDTSRYYQGLRFALFIFATIFFLFWAVSMIGVVKQLKIQSNIKAFKKQYPTYCKLYLDKRFGKGGTILNLVNLVNGEKRVFDYDGFDVFVYIPCEKDQASNFPTILTCEKSLLYYLSNFDEEELFDDGEMEDVSYIFSEPNNDYEIEYSSGIWQIRDIEKS